MYNTYLTIIVPALISMAVTYFSCNFLISYFYGAGIVGEDRNKGKAVKLASSGGIAVAFGMLAGILTYTFGGSFVFVPTLPVLDLMAAALSIVLISFVGFLDDVNVKSQRVKSTDIMDIREGLKQWQKPILTVIGALPLMAINAGVSVVAIPLIGSIDFGLLYPLVIIPLAVVFVSNAFNLLGGFDGLQSGTGLVASLGLVIYSFFYSNSMGLLLSVLLFAALVAFYPFNKYKARILPGDSFTYCVGGALVVIMVMGHEEAFGFVIFIPWIIEFFLHLRRKFKVSDLGIRQKDGTFKAPYGKSIYSLTHIMMNIRRMREEEVANFLIALEACFVVLAFALKALGLL